MASALPRLHQPPPLTGPRPHAAARGYDYRWQQYRRRYLTQHPLCLDCQADGYIRAATEVHHTHKLSDGGPRFDPANCRPLCHTCHSRRTARGE